MIPGREVVVVVGGGGGVVVVVVCVCVWGVMVVVAEPFLLRSAPPWA